MKQAVAGGSPPVTASFLSVRYACSAIDTASAEQGRKIRPAPVENFPLPLGKLPRHGSKTVSPAWRCISPA